MVRPLIVLLCAIISGCSLFAPKPKFAEVVYDYQVPPPYALTEKHKKISVKINDGKALPEKTLSFEKLKLNWASTMNNAQIQVFINYSEPFLIERPDGMRKDVVFDENGKGTLRYVSIQRGFIRTHYNIEVIDGVSDSLIRHVKFAFNFPIEAKMFKDKNKAKQALSSQFKQQKPMAEQAMLEDLWNKLKTAYLKDVVVTFAKESFNVVKEYEPEPKLAKAYELLLNNNKLSASKALAIYNQLNKTYSARLKEDDSTFNQRMLGYINQGITASSGIVNHDYASRY